MKLVMYTGLAITWWDQGAGPYVSFSCAMVRNGWFGAGPFPPRESFGVGVGITLCALRRSAGVRESAVSACASGLRTLTRTPGSDPLTVKRAACPMGIQT